MSGRTGGEYLSNYGFVGGFYRCSPCRGSSRVAIMPISEQGHRARAAAIGSPVVYLKEVTDVDSAGIDVLRGLALEAESRSLMLRLQLSGEARTLLEQAAPDLLE